MGNHEIAGQINILRFCGSLGPVNHRSEVLPCIPVLVPHDGHEVAGGPELVAVLVGLADGVERGTFGNLVEQVEVHVLVDAGGCHSGDPF